MRACFALLFGAAALTGALAAPLAAQTDSALIRRALRLHREVPMVDGHNDLPWEIRTRARSVFDSADIARPQPGLMTDIPRLRAGGVGAQFWSVWVPADSAGRGSMRIATEQLDLVRRMEARYPETFEAARTAADVVRIHRRGKIASLVGVEGGHAIENSLGALRRFYDQGVRYMTLTWNNGLAWADAAADTARHNGLTPFGREVVREMNRLGMLVDISHVSDSVMAQVLRDAEAPVIFSHSSARVLADVPRNVPDAILAMLPRNGGVVLVNFYCAFLDSAWVRFNRDSRVRQQQLRAEFSGDTAGFNAARRAWQVANRPPLPPLAVVADHIDHIRRIAGVDHVGYGSDFDGIDCAPQGLEDVGAFPRLTAELLRRGYSDEEVRKVIGLNALRALREAEEVAATLQRQRPPSTATLAGMDSVGVRR